jgi:flavin reductase (DIM6/NTAB) family NADH-FMN oxidoreductase RutF
MSAAARAAATGSTASLLAVAPTRSHGCRSTPPLLLVCFDLGSATLRAIRGHGGFIVNARTAR